MKGNITRRAAACGGALAIAIGAGALVAPAAHAAVPVIVPTTPAAVAITPTADGTTAPVITQVVAPIVTPVVTQVVAPTTTPVLTPTTTPVVDAVVELLNSGSGSTGSTGSAGSSGSSNGGTSITVGSDGAGGSVVSVGIGGSQAAGGGTTGAAGMGGTPGTSGIAGATGSTGSPGTNGAAGTSGSAAGIGGVAATTAQSTLLGLDLKRSVATVFPVKDGYRDQVTFSLGGLTSNGEAQPVDGIAVLQRGKTVIKRWTLTRSDQVLTWNGTSGSKVVSGTYRLVAAAKDAAHHSVSDATSVKVSPKRLVAATKRLSALAVSGKHTMAAAPRAGLKKGRVTVRVTTVASKVVGRQRLVFQNGSRQLVVPLKQGTHTSKAITVPAAFTTFTIKHSWKKAQVKLQAIRYTYSYQTLK